MRVDGSGTAGAVRRLQGGLAIGVLVALFIPPPAYPQLFAIGGAEVRLLDGLFALFLVALVASGKQDRLPLRWLARTPTALALAALLALLAVSVAQVPAGDRADAAISVAKLAEVLVVALLAGVAIARRGLLAPFAAALGVAAAVSAVVAIAGAGEQYGAWGLVLGRGFGVGDLNPDVLALGGVAAVVLGLAVTTSQTPRERHLGLLSLAGGMLALLAAKSLIATIVLIVGVVALFVLTRRPRPLLLGLALSAVVMGLVIPARLPDLQGYLRLDPTEQERGARRSAAEAGGSIMHRVIAVYIAGLVGRDNLVTGVGWLQTHAPRYAGHDTTYPQAARRRFPNADPDLFPSESSPNPVHNAYAQTLAEAGLLAVLALLAALAAPLWVAVRCARRSQGSERLVACAAGAVLFTGAIWLNGVSPLASLDMALPWAAAGMAVGLASSVRREPAPPVGRIDAVQVESRPRVRA